jgi:hypothetical protein
MPKSVTCHNGRRVGHIGTVVPVVTGKHGHFEAGLEVSPVGAIWFEARDMSEGWEAGIFRSCRGRHCIFLGNV